MTSPFRHQPPGAPAPTPRPRAGGRPLALLAVATLSVLPGLALAQAPTRRAAEGAARPAARRAAPVAPKAGAPKAGAPKAGAPKVAAAKPGAEKWAAAQPAAAKPAVPTAMGAVTTGVAKGPPLRLEVDIAGRRLYALRGQDTLLVTSAAVASQDTLAYAGRTWVFRTPKGTRRVLGKQSDPWWTPPDWFYAETAQRHGLKVRYLAPGSRVALSEGRRLVVRDSAVGVLLPNDPTFHPLPEDEHVVFGDTLFVPPGGTRHRRISGQLGAFRLDLGEGFLIHGTPDERTVGTASTHGCVRLDGVALAWVFQHTPVGTAVVIR